MTSPTEPGLQLTSTAADTTRRDAELVAAAGVILRHQEQVRRDRVAAEGGEQLQLDFAG